MRQNATPPDPPAGLSERSQTLWAAIVPNRAKSPGRLALLEQALRALDRADQCRAAVDTEGTTTTTATTKAVHLHPLLKAEREFRAQFLSAWSQLSLAWDGAIDGGEIPLEALMGVADLEGDE